MSDPTAQLLAEAKPRHVEVTICARGDLIDAHDEVERQLARQRSSTGGSLAGTVAPNDEITALAQRLVDLEDQIAAASVTYKASSIGRQGWADLKLQHRPSREQAKQGLDVNMLTFPQAAIAACCSPTITPEQSEQLTQVLPEGEWNKIWSAVLGVNLGVMDTPKSGAAAAILRANAN